MPVKLNKTLKHLFNNNANNINSISDELLENETLTNIINNPKIKNPSLIIIFSKANLKEIHKTKILTIFFNTDLLLANNYDYKIPSNLNFIKKQIKNNFFYNILYSILKTQNKCIK